MLLLLLLILASGFVHPDLLPTADIGPITIRLMDVASVLVVAGLFCRMCLRGSLRVPRELRRLFWPLVPLLAWMGVSVATTASSGLEVFAVSAVGYARLCVTCIIGFLAGVVLCAPGGLCWFQRVLVAGAIAAVLIALALSGSAPAEAADIAPVRYAGITGINTLGLVGAILILYGLMWPHEGPRWLLRAALVAMGIGGLALSRSASSIGATFVILALLLTRGRTWTRFTLLPLFFGIAFTVVWLARAGDIEGLLSFQGGSFAHRFAVGYGGLIMFWDQPITGVGWQASIPVMAAKAPLLMAIFPSLPDAYFETEYGAPTVHNLYIQLLAELGLIGLAGFVWAAWRIARRLRCYRKASPVRSLERRWVQWCAWSFGLLLLWWNTNPLFGGQVETVLAMFLLGSCGAVLGKPRHKFPGSVPFSMKGVVKSSVWQHQQEDIGPL